MGAQGGKTNAMRLLDAAGVPYRYSSCEVDKNNLSGVRVAELLGLSPDVVFKTLVLQGERTGHLVCVIPSNCELDLKKAAKVAGDKKVEMIPQKQLLPTTGYIHGGCSPLGMKKKFPTYIDETAQLYDEISVSAGVLGCQIIVDPVALARVLDAGFHDLTAVD